MALFHESIEAFARVVAVFADQAERGGFLRFGNEPIEIRRVAGDEPHAHGIGRHIARHFDNCLDQRHGALARPTGGLGHAALRAVGADDGVGVDLLGLRRA